jgi:hypothetical protein
MTLNSQSPKPTEISEHGDTEVGVRRALGLEGVAPAMGRPMHAVRTAERFTVDRQKPRFVQDGEVPFVIVHGRRDNGLHAVDPQVAMGASPTNRLEVAETALKAERNARECAERSLTEAQATIRDLQTKLGHATLARDEARADARRVEIKKQTVELALAAEQDARQKAEQHLLDVMPAVSTKMVTERKSKAGKASLGLAGSTSTTKATPRVRSTKPEPKPVRWWIKPKKASEEPA